MTPEDPTARRPVQSPYAIRTRTFGTRRKGLDPDEVREYLNELAAQVEHSDAERARLRAELDRQRDSAPADAEQRAHITANAVGLLSQAQQIADNLVSEAEQYAKDLIESAREQQRDVLLRARDSVETAVRQLPANNVQAAELEYVRTFTQVAHVQLRSVLDALAEQVERLGHLPRVPDGPQPTTDALGQLPQAPASLESADGDVRWWTDLSSSDAIEPAAGSRSPAVHRRNL
ncbi:hypothetical protein Kfla_4791 [Kribbella flavida DSM 17836]|uniref:Cell wall synthesis protein Wag31 n=1 Tax=Kribbella flavida (strain DSM 17836 / JCM 10339 / NBRC 14399) TaxID=479435 RepID=D2Q0K8_KRIFD|nr:DivIVA domain-containing protein [Kribbella flavida]ADB33808.1 hypothetical protein Kfla_4791 [Kribbella flavida DSM 17836]